VDDYSSWRVELGETEYVPTVHGEKMRPRYPIREIMLRTIRNLQFIEAQATLKGPYDTTQLINSFLGAFVHVKERFDGRIPTVSFPPPGWPSIQTNTPHRHPRNLRQFIRSVRNGISHGNVELLGKEKINGIRIWNTPPGSSVRNWEADISEAELRQLLIAFVKLMTPILRQHEAAIR
jgi:hypothetical protein